MPQIQNIERFNWQMVNQSGVRETSQGNIVVQGQYLTSSSLSPLGVTETLGAIPNSQYQYYGQNAQTDSGIGSAPPMAMLNGVQNWNLWLGQCHYYASGFGQLKPIINDTDRGYTWTLMPRLSGGQLGGFGYHSGASAGFGITRNLGWKNAGTNGTYNVATTQILTRNATDQIISTQIIGDVTGNVLNNPLYSGYIPGYIGIDRTSGTRYLWKPSPAFSNTTLDSGQTSYLPTASLANPTGTQRSLIIDASTPTSFSFGTNYITSYLATATTVSVAGTASFGISALSPYMHFIYATPTYIYFVFQSYGQMTAGSSGTAAQLYWQIKKMTYGGTETLVVSLAAGAQGLATFGYTLPTAPFNVTTTNANVIFPYCQSTGTVGGALGATTMQFGLMNINIPNGTETVTYLTNGTANLANATIFYNRVGLNGATTSTGPIANNDWRYCSTIRTWTVQGVTGQVYLNISFENTYYSYGTWQGRAMTTVPSSTANNNNVTSGGGYKVKDAFCIYTYTLDTGLTTAQCVGNTDMGNYLPRWYMPVTTSGLVQWVSCAWDGIYDIIIKFNEGTYKWDTVSTLNYRADQVGVDSQGRIWATSSLVGGTLLSPRTGAVSTIGSDAIFIEGANLPLTVNVTLPSNAYTYSGSTIGTNFTMNVTNFLGTRIASNVLVQLTGSLQFTNGTTQQYITTSASADTTTNINVVGSISGRINTTITQVL